MQRMRRATGILVPALVLVLAACGSPDTGGQASDGGSAAQSQAMTSQPAAPAGSAAPSGGETGGAERVDVFTLTQDPGALAGSEIRVLARVDEVVTDNEAFYTSPGGGEEGRLLVVVADDATVDKELAAGVNVFMTGKVTGIEDLAAAGVSAEVPSDYSGEWAFVATKIGDPLADAGS